MSAASSAAGRILARLRLIMAARPPLTTVAAATWPLGLCTFIGANRGEHVRNISLKVSVAAKVPATTPKKVSAPRRQPCAVSAMATASTRGIITAWSAKSVRYLTQIPYKASNVKKRLITVS